MWEQGVDVVVPIRGDLALTERCLKALAAQTQDHRTTVVDDGSPEDAMDVIRAGFPDVEVLALGADRGHAVACNAGIARGTGGAIVLLAGDVIAPPRFLERLLAPLGHDTRIGSVAAVLLAEDELAIDSVGLTVDRTLAGFPRLRGRPECCARMRRPKLLGPTGAAGAYRRAALAAVGGLDERIFDCQVDLDLALRLCAAGWITMPAHDARAIHLNGDSAPASADVLGVQSALGFGGASSRQLGLRATL